MIAEIAPIIADINTVMLPVLADSSKLVTTIRNFIAPIVLLVVSIFALTFLFKQQYTKMLGFIVIAIAVFAIFYVPEMLTGLGRSFGSSNRNLSFD